jgi:GT2 family glycosyltransferase/Flp pilus assembly protein TadD
LQASRKNFVSIVIPVHNQVAYTQACLRALNSFPPHIDHEIIIVDDGSSDSTPQLLSQLSASGDHIRTIRHECAHGFATACNRGADVARGDLLLFLNNDTEVQPGWFPPLCARIISDPGIGMVAPKLLFPDGTVQHCGKVWSDPTLPNSHPHHIYYRFPSGHPAVNKSRQYMMVTGACILLRTADFRGAGGFDERYENGWEDDDLCYAITSTGKRIFYCAESVVIHHQNKTLNERMDELKRQLPTAERLHELDTFMGSGSVSPAQVQLARQVQATFQAMEAELLRLRDKFQRNRRLFFEKWGAVVRRDDSIYCREDGVPLHLALPDVASCPASGEERVSETTVRNGGGDMPLVSIIILTCNRLDVTRECIASIQRHTPEPHEIIFVDNGSTDGTLPWLRELAVAARDYRLIENSSNLGFSAGCNQGMRDARGAFILLLNNDVIVTPEWLSGLLECFDQENVGIVGPMTDNISGMQRWPWVTCGGMEELDEFSMEFRRANRFRRIPTRRVVGFCMLFRRALIDRIGLLDEQFGSGNFEDDDYCLRAALEGFQNLVAADVFIHHVGSATFQGSNIDYREALLRNQALFNQKWSRPVSDTSLARKIIRLKTAERAELLNLRGFADEAVSLLLNQGIKQLPDDPLFYHMLVRIFLDAGMPHEALAVLVECPFELPASTRLLRVRALLDQGKKEEAIRCFQDISAGHVEEVDFLVQQGLLLLGGGDLSGAARCFEKVCRQNPPSAHGFAGLAEVTHLAGDELLAAELAERAFRLVPSDITIARHYHATVVKPERLVRGERLLAESRHFYPDSDTLAYLHIDILLRLERYRDAMEVIEHALVTFKWGEGFLDAAQSVRERLGPLVISPEQKQGEKTISLCMIVKNEEKNLPRCLKSLLPIVDEMIIADTGSTDRTREIAAIFGARVISIPWNGDYAEARNASLSEAVGDWILVMDADEVISPQDYASVRSLINSSPDEAVAYTVTSRNYTSRVDLEKWQPNRGEYPQEEMGRGWMPSDKTRLFPNQATIRFENPIHEMVEPSLDRLGILSLAAPFVVHHYGYLDDKRQQRKLLQYYELGKRKMAETGGSPQAIVELAIQAAGIKKYDEAISLWQRALEIDPNSSLAYFNLGYVYLQLGMFREGSDATRRALELKGNYREAQVNYLLCQLCLGNIDTSLEAVERYVAENPDYPILILMRGVLWAAKGDKERGVREFSGLRDTRVEFSQFIHEVTKRLLQAGQKSFAANLVEIAEISGCCKEETVLMVT